MNLKQSQIATRTIFCLLALFAIPSICPASGKVVKCFVENNQQPAFRGNCFFSREKGGSFTLRNAEQSETILEGIMDVSVYIIGKDIAEVRGITTDGISSRWGEARRLNENKACWAGSDFMICAW